jgi:uncharacterized iron-regulated membrane protein
MTFEQILGTIIGLTMLCAFAYILWQWRKREKEYRNIEHDVRFYDGR